MPNICDVFLRMPNFFTPGGNLMEKFCLKKKELLFIWMGPSIVIIKVQYISFDLSHPPLRLN
jgi:hypothetical protein